MPALRQRADENLVPGTGESLGEALCLFLSRMQKSPGSVPPEGLLDGLEEAVPEHSDLPGNPGTKIAKIGDGLDQPIDRRRYADAIRSPWLGGADMTRKMRSMSPRLSRRWATPGNASGSGLNGLLPKSDNF